MIETRINLLTALLIALMLAAAGFAVIGGSSATTTTENPIATSVLDAVYAADNAGFHDLTESYATATEIGARDAGKVLKVLQAVNATDWPDALEAGAAEFAAALLDAYIALSGTDVEAAHHALEGVHDAQHGFGGPTYAWLEAGEYEDHTPSSVLSAVYAADNAGFHGMTESYASATEIGSRDAGKVLKILQAVNATDWPHEIEAGVDDFAAALLGAYVALSGDDVTAAHLALEGVHDAQHGFSGPAYAWLEAGVFEDILASTVLMAVYTADNFGFHGLTTDYATATEIGARDAGNVLKVLRGINATAWPHELETGVNAFEVALIAAYTALSGTDVEAAHHALEGVHDAQHDFSGPAYEWLESGGVTAHADDDGDNANTDAIHDNSDGHHDTAETNDTHDDSDAHHGDDPHLHDDEHMDGLDVIHPGNLTSGEILTDESWSYVFNEVGMINYHCHPHPNMIGMIHVNPDDPNAESGEVFINLIDFKVSPQNISILPGTTVTWINHDSVYHTVDVESAGHAHGDDADGDADAHDDDHDEDAHADDDQDNNETTDVDGGSLPFIPIGAIGLLIIASLGAILFVRRR